MPKVSICIPTYNNVGEAEVLLKRIISQNYNNYEIIITDDSTDDQIEKMVSRFYGSIVNYTHNPKPLGHIYNWNAALEKATGEYVKIMFSDDYFTDNDSLGKMVALLDEHPDASMAFCGSRQVSSKGSTDRFAPPEYIEELKKDYRYLFISNQIGAPSATIYRRNLDVKFDEKSNWASDVFLYFEILRRNPHFAYTEEPLVSIGVHENQYTESFDEYDERKFGDYAYMYAKYDLEKSKVYRDYYLNNYIIPYKKGPGVASDYGIKKLDYIKSAFNVYKDAIAHMCFYLAFLTELLIVLVDKSAYINPIESYLFRFTFALCCIKILLTRYTRKEWLLIAGFSVLGFISYRVTGRNEILRIVMFVAAFKGMKLNKIMKLAFYVYLAGTLALMVMSLTGILGWNYIEADFNGDLPGGYARRYCFGMGHPNALHCMFYMIVMAAAMAFWDRINYFLVAVLFVSNIGLYFLTHSKSAAAMSAVVLIFWVVMNKRTMSRFWSVSGVLGLIAANILSMIAVHIGWSIPLVKRIDDFFNCRIGAAAELTKDYTWTLFASPEATEYFDMGFVKVYYWFGIIPGIVYVIVIALMIIQCRKANDRASMIVTLSLLVYTVVEAHIVSDYIARNYIFMTLGAYWTYMFGKNDKTEYYLHRILSKETN